MLERMPATPRYRAPYLPSFSGDSKSGEYRNWKRAVLSAMDNFDEYTVIQAIRKSISSQPARIISNLDYDCSVDDIINALNNAYDDIHDDTLSWQVFYNATQNHKEDVIEWHTRLCSLWSNIPNNPINKEEKIKIRLWQGLRSDSLREPSRHKYDMDYVTVASLLKYLRQLENNKSSKSGFACGFVSRDTDSDVNVINLQKKVDELTAQLSKMKQTCCDRGSKTKQEKDSNPVQPETSSLYAVQSSSTPNNNYQQPEQKQGCHINHELNENLQPIYFNYGPPVLNCTPRRSNYDTTDGNFNQYNQQYPQSSNKYHLQNGWQPTYQPRNSYHRSSYRVDNCYRHNNNQQKRPSFQDSVVYLGFLNIHILCAGGD